MEAVACAIVVGMITEMRFAVARLGKRMDAIDGWQKIHTAEHSASASQIHGVIALCAGAAFYTASTLM